MKVLITGGAGFVGSNLAMLFMKSGPDVEVTVLDNLRRRGSELSLPALKKLGVRFIHGDIRSPSDLDASGTDFDLLIEASAEPSVHAGMDGSPDYVVQTNLLGAYNCLNFARRHAREFIFLSTSRVYSIAPLRAIALEEDATRLRIGKEQTLPGVSGAGVSEDFDTRLPRSLYGATKLAAEYLVQEFSEAYGLKSMIYRCGVIAGPGQYGTTDQGVFAHWVIHHYFGKPLRYTGFGGQGKQVRDLLHPADLFDLIQAHLSVPDRLPGYVYNVGGGLEISISLAELTAICGSIVGRTVPIASQSETAAVDVPLYITNYRRIASVAGWRPTRSVEVIVTDILNWIRANESELRRIFT